MEMAPKLSVADKGRKKAKTGRKVVTYLRVIIPEMKKKEADTPLYLLRYDD